MIGSREPDMLMKFYDPSQGFYFTFFLNMLTSWFLFFCWRQHKV